LTHFSFAFSSQFVEEPARASIGRRQFTGQSERMEFSVARTVQGKPL